MNSLLSSAIEFLDSLQRRDLSTLLSDCELEIHEEEKDAHFWNETVAVATVHAPAPVDRVLQDMPDYEKKRIAEAIFAQQSLKSDSFNVRHLPDKKASEQSVLLSEILLHQQTMIAVATGQGRIQDVNDHYKAREFRLSKKLPKEIYSNPHKDLWDWYKFWKQQYSSYSERRAYVRQLFAKAIDHVAKRPAITLVADRESTGWERVDRAIQKARSVFSEAKVEEDFQTIGLLCREVLISLAQAVFDPQIHRTLDGVVPSSTDANRMLEAFIASEVAGGSDKELRAHIRASLALALNLQHRRTANRMQALLCLEATSSASEVVRIVSKEKR